MRVTVESVDSNRGGDEGEFVDFGADDLGDDEVAHEPESVDVAVHQGGEGGVVAGVDGAFGAGEGLCPLGELAAEAVG